MRPPPGRRRRSPPASQDRQGRATGAPDAGSPGAGRAGALRGFVIGLTAFLTVVDLFAAQAILPTLAAAYGVSPAAMGTAVNASTLGMAASSLGVALLSRRIDRRMGTLVSLALLAVPTALLASAPDLASFTALRVAQGVFMAAAFALTLAHLGERSGPRDSAGAFAAYITGNVASNLVGRLVSAALTEHLGLKGNFYAFALLNLAGAVLVFFTLGRAPRLRGPAAAASRPGMAAGMSACATHLRNPRLRAGFAIGFCLLFAFIGTFTYVKFVLVREPFALSPMALGLVYFVFLPSVVTTPLAGRVVARIGTRPTFWASLGAAGAGLPLLLLPALPAVLLGLALVAAGTFMAQAAATGFVSRAATADRGTASGMYLACYFAGGLAGSVVLGRVRRRHRGGARGRRAAGGGAPDGERHAARGNRDGAGVTARRQRGGGPAFDASRHRPTRKAPGFHEPPFVLSAASRGPEKANPSQPLPCAGPTRARGLPPHGRIRGAGRGER